MTYIDIIVSAITVITCLILVQIFRLVGDSKRPKASSFASLPYAFGISAITVNSSLSAVTVVQNTIMSVKVVIAVIAISILVMGFIMCMQRWWDTSDRKKQITSSIMGFVVLLVTYVLWIVGTPA